MKKLMMTATIAALAMAATIFSAFAAEKLKAGFIYVGPIGDFGWTSGTKSAARKW